MLFVFCILYFYAEGERKDRVVSVFKYHWILSKPRMLNAKSIEEKERERGLSE